MSVQIDPGGGGYRLNPTMPNGGAGCIARINALHLHYRYI
jgi:hypothetical protein